MEGEQRETEADTYIWRHRDICRTEEKRTKTMIHKTTETETDGERTERETETEAVSLSCSRLICCTHVKPHFYKL